MTIVASGHEAHQIGGPFAFVEENKMAKKKTEDKKPAKVTYKKQKYTVMEEQGDKLKLTDGIIHFWVKKDNVEA